MTAAANSRKGVRILYGQFAGPLECSRAAGEALYDMTVRPESADIAFHSRFAYAGVLGQVSRILAEIPSQLSYCFCVSWSKQQVSSVRTVVRSPVTSQISGGIVARPSWARPSHRLPLRNGGFRGAGFGRPPLGNRSTGILGIRAQRCSLAYYFRCILAFLWDPILMKRPQKERDQHATYRHSLDPNRKFFPVARNVLPERRPHQAFLQKGPFSSVT
jgi:hypothetical protein